MAKSSQKGFMGGKKPARTKSWARSGTASERSGLFYLLTLALIAALAFAAATFYLVVQDSRNEQEWTALTTDIQVNSQQLAKSASEAATGTFNEFVALGDARAIIADDIKMLREGDTLRRLPAAPSSVGDELAAIEQTWQRMNSNALEIIDRETKVLQLSEASERVINAIPELQALTDEVMRELTQNGAPSQQIFVSGRQLVLSDRILRHLREMLDGGRVAESAAKQFEQEVDFFEDMLNSLLRGSVDLGIPQVRNANALNALGQVRQIFLDAKPDVRLLLDGAPDIIQVGTAADELLIDSRQIFDQAGEMTIALQSRTGSLIWPSLTSAIAALLLSLAITAYIVFSFLTAERKRASRAGEQNQRNQTAILRLLDEMSSLADGDLTVKATVTNDVTGAIADAVNYTVEQLREVVTGINLTAQTVFESAEETRQRTSSLAASSANQAEQVREITDTINKMSESFSDMARDARESNEVSQKSLEMARTGSQMVQQTIKGMDTIRDQIQDTSKRIKRLGESSQEIGDIVELINGIAEQTNILALNAAIQSASAGGAGKGFAVVADEVQQLAERASNATRRIELLVQTIQADTSEAIVSMESTTAEVVAGAKMSEDAGDALNQISSVSEDLSRLIDEISTSAQTHSEVANDVAGDMNTVLNIAIETSEGSKVTARSMGELADLVAQLSASVTDFKLPDKSH